MSVTPLREASDVAVRTLTAPMTDALGMLRHGRVRRLRPSSHRVRWDVVNLDVEGRRLRYRVTTETPDERRGSTTWAMSLHGYFAGGSMYARESESLAARLGWRVVNPSLPGFGGSDPFGSDTVCMDDLTGELARVKAVLGIDRMVLLGHSMGAAVATHYAANHPDDVLGLVYRDGVATPGWQQRHGALARVLATTMPDVAPVADMVAAAALDLPDLLAGHVFATVRSMIPDLQHNIRMFARSAPVARMLRQLDLADEVRSVRAHGIPVLAEWGCFDRLIPPSTADEFAAVADVDVHWLPGGHSWMLARPGGQADVLLRMPWGRDFLDEVRGRASALAAAT
jgi:pimeloyl-ACP methyl ester carboxylesterase